jgi:hypothetical protein
MRYRVTDERNQLIKREEILHKKKEREESMKKMKGIKSGWNSSPYP